MIDPRQIALETIAKAGDAAVAEWIAWMGEDWIQPDMRGRTISEWVASAALNAWVMHDNCDANDAIIEALEKVGLAFKETGNLTKGQEAYNMAVWFAVAHQSPGIESENDLVRLLKNHFSLNDAECSSFLQVIMSAPKDGLERACSRALQNLPPPGPNVSGSSEQQALMSDLIEMPPDELKLQAERIMGRRGQKP